MIVDSTYLPAEAALSNPLVRELMVCPMNEALLGRVRRPPLSPSSSCLHHPKHISLS